MADADLLKAVAPSLTFYGVFLTLAVVGFKVAVWLRSQEQELSSEQVEKLKEMMLGFRRAHIEPLLAKQIRAATDAAYERSISSICDAVRGTLDADESVASVRFVVSESSASDRVAALQRGDGSVESFLLSKSGEDFLDRIDARYATLRQLFQTYHSSVRWIRAAFYTCVLGSISLLLAMGNVFGPWHDYVVGCWLFGTTELFALAAGSFLRFELLRGRQKRRWEAFEIYGQI